MRGLAAVLGFVGLVQQPAPVTLTISPAQRDFGRTVVRASSLQQFDVTPAPGSTITVSLTGPDALDFYIQGQSDRAVPHIQSCLHVIERQPLASCPVHVDFRPGSPGVKTATLVVATSRGRVTAALRGEGVVGSYSGSFAWQSDLNGPFGQNRQAITVTVVNGVATCDGTETDVAIDGAGTRTTEVGSIQGPGLIAVTFEFDSELRRPAYRVAVACPSPQWPPSVGRPSQPAAWGSSYSQESYQQPMPPPSARGVLDGSRSGAHPDVDSVNGVTGSQIVSWRLTPS